MFHNKRSILVLFLYAIALAAIALLILEYVSRPKPNTGTSGISGEIEITGTADVGGPYTLMNHLGETVDETTYQGTFNLIYFGYAFCPDICPFDLQKMTAALIRFEENGGNINRITPIFITIDPARDTVSVLNQYVTQFHPRLIGMTGTPEQIKEAADAYKVFYRHSEGDDDNYLMDHSSLIYLMGSDGLFVDHFTPMDSPQSIYESLMRHVN